MKRLVRVFLKTDKGSFQSLMFDVESESLYLKFYLISEMFLCIQR